MWRILVVPARSDLGTTFATIVSYKRIQLALTGGTEVRHAQAHLRLLQRCGFEPKGVDQLDHHAR
jgi:hypothetical protein